MTKFKHCPFCGGKKIYVKTHDYHPTLPTMYGVVCYDCQAGTCQFYRSIEEAIEAWEKREGDKNE